MYLSDQRLLAYRNGRQAFLDGLTFSDNPHSDWPNLMVYWYEGYCDEEMDWLLSTEVDEKDFPESGE